MGINSINCEGQYSDVKESGFGNGTRGSSDFDIGDIAAIGVIASIGLAASFTYRGLLEAEQTSSRREAEIWKETTTTTPSATYDVDRSGPVTVGRIEDSYKSGYRLKVEQDLFGVDKPIALIPITDGKYSDDTLPSAICDIIGHSALIDSKTSYFTQCDVPDRLKIGDFVAVYNAVKE